MAKAKSTLIVASTTSTENSGLFAYILPVFEKKTGIKVKVVARGTGAAIEMGKRGDADVAFVHAKEQEIKAVEEGYFVGRRDVMYNDFVIIGPPDDPAKIKGGKSASDAFRRIADEVRGLRQKTRTNLKWLSCLRVIPSCLTNTVLWRLTLKSINTHDIKKPWNL